MVGKRLLPIFLIIAAFSFSSSEEEIGVFDLQRGDFSVKITNFGARVISAVLPDRNGKLDDVVLGYDSPEAYKNDTNSFGAIVGRVANRIRGANFTLNGRVYKLAPNDHGNTLHGGVKGYSLVVWTVKSHVKDSHLTLTYHSFDGEEGFPGAVSVSVTYLLIGTNKLGIKMTAEPLNEPTPINLLSHTYWNLNGHNSTSTILSHTIQISASNYTPVDSSFLTTGEIVPVENTPYDFREPQTIYARFGQLAAGYDINYALDRPTTDHFTRAAVAYDGASGRRMELWTNQPALQFYTSNMMKDTPGKGGFVYRVHSGFCLETQGFPDALHHANFPSQIVGPGEVYVHAMVYRFTVR